MKKMRAGTAAAMRAMRAILLKPYQPSPKKLGHSTMFLIEGKCICERIMAAVYCGFAWLVVRLAVWLLALLRYDF